MATALETSSIIGSGEIEFPRPTPVDKPAELTVPTEIVGAWAAVPVRNPAWQLASDVLAAVLLVAVVLAMPIFLLLDIRRVEATASEVSPQDDRAGPRHPPSIPSDRA